MIYEFPEPDSPIRQGDIFVGLPRVELSLDAVILAEEDGQRIARWDDLANLQEPTTLIVPVRPVAAIVATQDCDALRSRDITLCEIRPFLSVERKANKNTKAKGYKNLLTQHARINQKWFYLPPDERVGFKLKMAADFLVTLCLPLKDLMELRTRRRGRLNNLADEHFRERISEFFRRYPYDEWYPLDKHEFAEYKKDYPDVEPFGWQRTSS